MLGGIEMLEFKSQMFTYKFTGHVNLITGIDRFGGDSGRGKTSFFYYVI